LFLDVVVKGELNIGKFRLAINAGVMGFTNSQFKGVALIRGNYLSD
jgi:hypothetical protein